MGTDPYRQVTRIPVVDPWSGGVYFEEHVREFKRETCQLLQTGLGPFLKAGNTLDRAAWSVKFNGWRFRAVCEADGSVTFLTRSDEQHHFSAMTSSLKALAGRFRNASRPGKAVVFDGELTSPDDNPDTLHRLIDSGSDGSDLTYRIFDVVRGSMPLEQRLELLRLAFDAVRPGPRLYRVPHVSLAGKTARDVRSIQAQVCAHGFEGIVVKALDAPYIFRRTPDWIRMVAVETEDLPVLRVERRRAGRVSLICRYRDREVGVSAGISMEQGRQFLNSAPAVVEVTHRGQTGNGSLKSAAFVRVRSDKEA